MGQVAVVEKEAVGCGVKNRYTLIEHSVVQLVMQLPTGYTTADFIYHRDPRWCMFKRKFEMSDL